MGLLGVLPALIAATVGVGFYILGAYDVPLPVPLSAYRVIDIPDHQLPDMSKTLPFTGVLAPNEALLKATKVPGVVSETVAVCPSSGNLVLLDRQGYLYYARPNATAPGGYVVDPQPTTYLGPGMPLGVTCDADGRITFCDSLKGLMQYDPTAPDGAQLLVLANYISHNSPLDAGSVVTLANDLDVSQQDGSIYFTDSQDIPVVLRPDGRYDALHAYMMGLTAGAATGRLLKYNPTTCETHVLAKNIWFANGVALAADESFVLVAETNRMRILRYWLKGKQAGTTDVFTDHLPGLPDGLTRASDGGFWVALAAPLNPKVNLIKYKAVRAVLACFPSLLEPKRWGAVLKLSADGKPQGVLMDSAGQHVNMVTGVAEHNGRLFMGSLKTPFVSYIDISETHLK